MSTTLFELKGAPVLYHREGDLIPCPCRTPEGYRDPTWHKANPKYPECNAAGFIPQPTEFTVKGFVQPAFSAGSRGGMNRITQLFGEVQTDDHVGMFPMVYRNHVLNFDNWSPAGEEYIEYKGMRFLVVGWSIIPDPHDSSKSHHWEVGLRRINRDLYGAAVGY